MFQDNRVELGPGEKRFFYRGKRGGREEREEREERKGGEKEREKGGEREKEKDDSNATHGANILLGCTIHFRFKLLLAFLLLVFVVLDLRPFL